MKTAIIAYSAKGAALGQKIYLELKDSELYVYEKYAGDNALGFKKIDDILSATWGSSAIVFICACGIAVRAIAPYVKSKLTDSAVVVCDERGQSCISLLAGHIGGANVLAKKIGAICGAQPIITTATDINGIAAPDEWAVNNGLIIDNPDEIKHISARLLEEKKIGIVNETDLVPPYGSGESDCGIYIGYKKLMPFEHTLRLVPKSLCIGVGCKRGADIGDMYSFISNLFEENNYLLSAVALVASIDIKADEAAILELARRLDAKTSFLTAAELNKIEGSFSSSQFVKKTVGTDCVCERAAAAFGRLILKKQTHSKMTAAISVIGEVKL